MKPITEYLVNNHIKPQISFAASEGELTDGSYYKLDIGDGQVWLGKAKKLQDKSTIRNYYTVMIKGSDNDYYENMFCDLIEDHYIPGPKYITEYITEVTKEDISIIQTVEEYLKDPIYGMGPNIEIINGKANLTYHHIN